MKKKQEKNKATSTEHFHKEKVECKKCHLTIDAYLKRCPHCYEKRNPDVLAPRFSNMLFLTDYKEFLLFIIGTVGFLLIGIFVNLGVKNFPLQENLKTTLDNFITYIIVISLLACVLSYDVKEIFNSFKNSIKHRLPIILALGGLALIVGFSYAYSAILNACGVTFTDNANQTQLVDMVKSWPGFAFFFIVLFAPISEELTYRVGLFSIARKRNRYLAYALSILIFALAHFNFGDPASYVNECLNLPLYIVPAFTLTIVYEYGGASAAMYTHILNNLISFIVVLNS